MDETGQMTSYSTRLVLTLDCISTEEFFQYMILIYQQISSTRFLIRRLDYNGAKRQSYAMFSRGLDGLAEIRAEKHYIISTTRGGVRPIAMRIAYRSAKIIAF